MTLRDRSYSNITGNARHRHNKMAIATGKNSHPHTRSHYGIRPRSKSCDDRHVRKKKCFAKRVSDAHSPGHRRHPRGHHGRAKSHKSSSSPSPCEELRGRLWIRSVRVAVRGGAIPLEPKPAQIDDASGIERCARISSWENASTGPAFEEETLPSFGTSRSSSIGSSRRHAGARRIAFGESGKPIVPPGRAF